MFVGFSRILYIFTAANRSCQDDCRTRSRIGPIWTKYCVDPIPDVAFNVDALDGSETSQREPQRTQRDAQWKDCRSKLRYD